MIEIYLIILGLLSAWEEINELIRDKSWQGDMFYSFLFWETKPVFITDQKGIKRFFLKIWKSLKKLLDSKHVSFGAFALVLCIMVQNQDNLHKFTLDLIQFLGIWSNLAYVLILWWFFFYIRNIGMHILFRKNAFRQWKYLSSINF